MNRKQRRAAMKASGSPAVGTAEALNREGLAAAAQSDGDARRLLDAVDLFHQACTLNPKHAEAHNNLGATLHRLGRPEEAAEACRKALALAPDYAPALYNLGLALKEMDRLDEAAETYQKALAVRPGDPDTLNNLGGVLNALNRPAEAEAAFRRILPLREKDPEAHNNLGAALVAQGKFDEGMAAYTQAIALRPNYAEAHCNIGAAFCEQGRFAEAVEAARTALAFQPTSATAHNNLGIALQALGRLDEAESALRAALRLQDPFPEAHYSLSTILLQRGNYRDGWREYEWRWKGGATNLTPRTFSQPRWNGEDLTGRTILLYAEQGLGDALQFARYASAVAARGGRVILEVAPPLVRLLGSVPGMAQVVEAGRDLPPFDCHLPLMSAPFVLGTTLETIPADIPYVRPDPDQLAVWRDRLNGLDGFKVGLVWSGDPRPQDPRAHAIDKRRSLTLSQLTPVLQVPGASFISLQKGSPAKQLESIAAKWRPLDWMEGIADFAATAALVASLDLVITVDTSVAHLAGAMGKPVWILSRFDGCWRWLMDRDDSPWYPTARLFRQREPGNWDAVVAQVAEELARLTPAPCGRGRGPRSGRVRGLTRSVRKILLARAESNGAPTRAPLTRSLRAHPLPQGARVELPSFAEALRLQHAGHSAEAEALYRRILDHTPDHPASLYNLGLLALGAGRAKEAVSLIRRALAQQSDDPVAYYNLGVALHQDNRPAEAADAYRLAIDLRPDYHKAHNNLGAVLMALEQPGPAEAAFRTALALKPDYPEAHYNLGTAALMQGDFATGWREFEWRWRGGARRLTARPFPQPQWDGEDPSGMTILLHAEQGLGDALQFARYAPLIAARGANVILEVYPPLVRLLGTLPGTIRIVAQGDPLPAFDRHLPLMSVPLAMGTTLATIPATVPYLHAEPTRVAAWIDRLAALPGLKVGLVWAGEPRTDDPEARAIDRRRSLAFERMAPLLALPGVTFVSLQKGAAAAQLDGIAPDRRPQNWMDEIGDFADTAALVAALDLVISVDTSVAHLAGALGKPLWILSRFGGCWRWLMDRGDSPWYPTARLFRQKTPGDWDAVVALVAEELENLTLAPCGRGRGPRSGRVRGLTRSVRKILLARAESYGAPTRAPLTRSRRAHPLPQGARVNNSELFAEALRHHQAGRLDKAETLYRSAIADNPRHADSHYNLGLIALRKGAHETAVEWLRRAVDLQPANAEAWTNLGSALQALGRLEEAIGAFRTSLDLRPDDARVHYNLALALGQARRHQDATVCFRAAITLNPALGEAYNNLAVALVSLGQTKEAIPSFQRAIDLLPKDADSRFNFGLALQGLGRIEEAAAAFQAATDVDPRHAEAHGAFGAMCLQMGRPAETGRACRTAIALAPDNATARSNLAAALFDSGQFDDALAVVKTAIALRPDFAIAYDGLGVTLQAMGKLAEAKAAFEIALALDQNRAEAHFNLATTLLRDGDFSNGWREYEWRWRRGPKHLDPKRLPQPQWTGEDLTGRTLLLHGEQGLGDILQFVRYAASFAALGARVVIEVPAPLTRLLATVPGVSQVVETGETLPNFDIHLPMMSAPGRLGTTLDNIPADIPYVTPDHRQAAGWRTRLASLPGLKVGLVWAGNPRADLSRNHLIDQRRSMALTRMMPMLSIPGISFVSLQKDQSATQLNDIAETLRPHDWMDDVTDFADTAALVANLDLVVTVDTSMAHLAGAMGKPVWILSRYDGCWRWLMDREDSPWYPTARLFRQTTSGDWDEVVARVALELERLASPRPLAVACKKSSGAGVSPAFRQSRKPGISDAHVGGGQDARPTHQFFHSPESAETGKKKDSSETAARLFARAVQHYEAGRMDEAAPLYRRILAIASDHADSMHHLGLIALRSRRLSEAAHWIALAIAHKPDYAEAYNNLAIVRLEQGSLATACLLFARAVTIKPDYPAALSNWASALGEQNRWDDATVLCRQAIVCQPDFAGAYSNLGVIHSEMGRLTEAEASSRTAIALSPDHAEAQYNLGTALLGQGKYEEGWRQYEWRLSGNSTEIVERHFSEPEWSGDDLTGRTILLYGEQGLGDLLHFCRYATLIAARGGRVILECYPVLTRLLASVPGVAQVVNRGDPLPYFDCHLSVMSAPYRLGTTADNIPADIPYLRADAAQAAIWRQRLADLPGLKVGLVWAGDSRVHDRRANAIDRRRSMALKQMSPLLRLPGISFISLQKGGPASQLTEITPALRPWDWMDEVKDFADTAALVANLDLVIAVDTSVVHLAGALGKPVWILSRFDGCWRWLTEREDSPWYPTARLFRQKTHGDWEEVMERVAAELEGLAHQSLASLRAQRSNPASFPNSWIASPTARNDDNNSLFAEALLLHEEGRLSEAKSLYSRILETDPDHFDSLHHLGLIALWSDDAPKAVQWISKALMLNRSHIGAHFNLGKALSKMGRFADAVTVFRVAIEFDPTDAEAHYQLGVALHDMERPFDASQAYRQALVLKPDFTLALTNLGGALGEQERHEEAVVVSRRALAVDPGQSRAHSNLGASLHELHRIDDAIVCYRQAIALRPDLPETHHNLATALLLQGLYEEGLREYEWRWKGAIPGVAPRPFDRPLWQGEPLSGKTILLHGEQGLGDVLQFARYASLLAARGARVILEVYPPLTRLLATVPGVAKVLAVGDRFPAFDCHLPLLSAPLLLGTRIDSVPADVPYVTPNSSSAGFWRERLAHLPGLKVGLVWAGDPRTHSPRNNAVDRRRSTSLEKLKPLLAIPGISFVSLQKGEAATRQIQQIGAQSQIFDVMAEMTDFADTAALVANLDLVIAVDTSVAHLAGALAKPVWLLNRFNGCWRWLDDREGSPWYPTVRLFRQTSPGDWDTVVANIAIELRRLAEDGKVVSQTIEDLFAEAIGHHQENRLEEADALYRRILDREPLHPVILHHRGVIAQQRENPGDAVSFIRQALCSRPAYMEAWTNLATALRDLGERTLAEPCLRRAIRLQPNIAEAHNNLGSLCNELGRLDDAIAAFRTALTLQPDNPEIHCNLAAALLQRGDYAEGWREHEWRLHANVPWAKPAPLPQPLWTGEPLRGRTILLRNEQGLGDDIQFARFATPISALGAKVILEVHAPLARLLASVPGVDRVVTRGESLPDIDCYLSLMSAPHLLGITLETIPSAIPYVTPDQAAVTGWKKRLAHLPGLKVGLVWAGDPRPFDRRANAIDRRRSMPLSQLTPLLGLPGISFVSLQKGEAAEQIAGLPADLRPFDPMGAINDFADTAALMANLDLVISVDTSVVHLAGAMGKPVWILSRFDGCWRWLTKRCDSPWYPSARLFRQTEPGNWDEVVARVAAELETLTETPSVAPASPPVSSAWTEKNTPLEPESTAGFAGTPAGTPVPLENIKDLIPLVMAHHRAGRLTEAVALYRRILAIEPDDIFSLHHLGLIARQSGDYAEAERLIGRAVARAPDYAEALSNLGALLNDQGKAAQALACCHRAVILKPDYAKAHNNLGKSFKDLGKAADAATHYRRATLIDPEFTMAYSNLCAALQDLGRLADALSSCERALVLEPDAPIAHNNRGVTLSQLGDSIGAIRHYKRAARLAPDYAEMHVNLGMVLLLHGNFEDGWREYEWRWNGGMPVLQQRNFPQPRWAGDDLNGRTVLLHAEQGLGDSLQFVRYAKLLANRGASVILEVQAPLKRLLTTVPGVSQVVSMGEPLPAFDYYLPLMSCPWALGTTMESVPAECPYVTPDAAQTSAWRDRLSALPGLKVGLVWAGDPRAFSPDANLIDRRRSMALSQLVPLLRMPGISFISLQKNASAAQLQDIDPDLRPHDWMAEIGDFADTAALVANLDLVISVDTSVVHLAGAMGKPVWIASRFDGCWRWLADRDDSPWYPTARLFRQTHAGDWDDVVARMAVELERLSSRHKSPAQLFATATAHHQAGQLEDAVAAYRAVIGLDPRVAAAHVNLAVALAGLGQTKDAAAAFRQAIAIDPKDSKSQYNLGLAEQSLGHLQAAEQAFLTSLDLDPAHAKAHAALGVIRLGMGRPAEAETACRAALALAPDDADAQANFAASLFDQGRFGEVTQPARKAIALRPDHAQAYGGLALTLQIAGRPEEADAAYRRAIVLRPDDAETHHNLAMALLQGGDYQNGWPEYEWRWQDNITPFQTFSQPRWNGEDLSGRRILFWAEQGLGDTLQFIRYAPLIAARGGRVIACVQPALASLIASVPGVSQTVAQGDALPDFDFHLPMLSAPLLLGTLMESIPSEIPYIHPDPDRMAIWKGRLDDAPGLKVGLVWAGNPRFGDPRNRLVDGRRSIPLARMTPLLSVPGVRFISLQKGAPAAQIADIDAPLRPLDLMADVSDFGDTAALLAHLDLVITVDTAVAHLAGAMGKPVWILSRFDGCWRWFKDRDDSPWYPTARLFRQTAPGDWDEVMARVTEELGKISLAPCGKGGGNSELFAQAVASHQAGQLAEAEAAYRQLLSSQPDCADAMSNLGCLYRAQGRLDEALALHQAVAQRRPNHPDVWNNLGVTLKDLVRPTEAIAAFRQAIALKSDHAPAHANLAHVLLLSGQFAEGWREYAWRLAGGGSYLSRRSFPQPQWSGDDLNGRTLLLHAEQGLGDTLQFVRYAPLIAARGGRVLLEVQPPLKRLLMSVKGIAQVLGGDGEQLPTFDCHLPLLSAPELFGTTLETIPAGTPYLTADPTLVAAWKTRLADLPGLKIGLVWAGEPWSENHEAHAIDARRSIPLARLSPLLTVPGLSFVSLQKGKAAAQLRDIAKEQRPRDFMADVADFADTAALVANLDLVISVDTAVAHLAGALGKPVWILSRFDGCWRWLMGRDDSPWYPTARLFRQRKPGDWDEVVARVAEELEKLTLAPCGRGRGPRSGRVRGLTRSVRKILLARAESYGAPTRAPLTRSLRAHPLPQGARVDNGELFAQAIAHHQAGRLSEAEAIYLRMLSPGSDGPGQAEASCNLGILFRQQGRLKEAVARFRRALQLRPDYPEAHNNLGLTFNDQGDASSAVTCYERTLRLQPDNPLARSNLGVALQGLGRVAEAALAYRQALARQPDQAGTHYNLALALLAQGDYEEGWREHEWLWRGAVEILTPRHFACPRWEGEELTGKTILLYAEQGLGDALQFARYASEIAALGGRVLLEVHPPLKRLLQTVPGIAQCLAVGEPLPDFDFFLPLMAAPYRLGTKVASIPARVPYVTPDPALSAQWAARVGALPGLKVGLVWAGDPRAGDLRAHVTDRRRSIALRQLSPLLSVAGVSFVSLQKGAAAAQIGDLPPALRPRDWMEAINDFADTAALVAQLDLVITVDTAVAHLAGAMGKPVWIASRFDGCWRWLMNRDDSPWYPTARLFRQTQPGDWNEVVTRLAEELKRIPLTQSFAQEEKSNSQRFAEAVLHHQAGRLDEAQVLYNRILSVEPDNVGCLFHLGLLAQQQSRYGEAADLLQRALQRNGQIPGLHDALGTTLLALGRFPEAIAAHRRALAIKPDFFEASYNLGNAYQSQGDAAQAAACFRQTIVLRPDLAEPYNNLGNLLSSQNAFDAAAMCYRRAIVLHPHFAAAHNNLGNVLKEWVRLDEATNCFERAVHLQPDYVEAHYNLGNALLENAQVDAAIIAFRRAVAARPDLTEAYNNLGSALYLREQKEQAMACFERALRLDPRFPETHSNLGTALRDQGAFDQACAAYRQAIAFDPDYALAHSNLGVTLLLKGDFAEGLREFEWRRQHRNQAAAPRDDLPPRWKGENPAGRTILLQAEQGLGDVLQFVRYAPLIAALGARVILEVYPPLRRLLDNVQGATQILTTDDILPPDIDWHLPMMSAPFLLGTRLHTIPANVPYLTPDEDAVAAWGRRLAKLSGMKVGLVWAGDPRPHDPRAHAIDRRRSIALDNLTPLLSVPGVDFVSLQKGSPSRQIDGIPPELRPLDLMETVTDFADTAALLANLDLLIAVDTSVVHLAGAMGKPVWILSRFDGCWRWLTERDDSPWYPSARLFRQPAPGDWNKVIGRVTVELTRMATRLDGGK
jgi:tetratricopeptide (TPR) repeat protein